MGRRTRREVAENPEAKWTGRLEFAVTSPTGGFLGRLEMKIGWDDVSIFFDDRHMGLIDRTRLHRWFQRPREPLRFDDVTLTVHGRDVLLALDASPRFPMPRRDAAQLQAVV